MLNTDPTTKLYHVYDAKINSRVISFRMNNEQPIRTEAYFGRTA